jgi:ubiquinol-cytochrome c reductase cytochrome b subunit
MRTIWRWLDERLEFSPYWRAFLDRAVPSQGWAHTLGSATLFLLIVQVTTGIVLTLFYVPSPDHAYQSIAFIDATPFGGLVRGIHHWAAGVLVLLIALHALRVFVWAAYKYPRELNWLVGALLFIVVLGFAFTGYLLPWDQKAYWATVVGTNIAGQVPIIGGALLELFRGGTQLGAVTLVRFYGLHVWVLPAVLFLLLGIHLYALVRQGIAAHPRLTPLTETVAGESRREAYKREYAAAKGRAKPFYEQFYLDAIASLFLLIAVIALAIGLGAPLDAQADPNASGYVPRPEWYFLSLFQLLWYFSGPLEPLLISAFFAIAALVFVIVPFLDRNPERHWRRRPIALGLAAIATVGVVGLTVLGATSAPSGLPTVAAHAGMSQQELSGLTIFNEQGCTACHSVGGVGGSAGPPLPAAARWDAERIRRQIVSPEDEDMPAFDELSPDELDQLVAFLLSLKPVSAP